jgi:hypothetical protein
MCKHFAARKNIRNHLPMFLPSALRMDDDRAKRTSMVSADAVD